MTISFFFTGTDSDGSQFDFYNTTTGKWSKGQLSQTIHDAGVIVVNNTIYGWRKCEWCYFNPGLETGVLVKIAQTAYLHN